MSFYFISTLIYGIFVIVSGVYRYQMADSKNALWFGIVMGSIAILGSIFYLFKLFKTSFIFLAIVSLFVFGFFANKMLGDLEGDSVARVTALNVSSLLIGILIIKEWVKITKK